MGTEPPRLGKLINDLRKAHCEKQQKLVRFLNIDFNTGTGRWTATTMASSDWAVWMGLTTSEGLCFTVTQACLWFNFWTVEMSWNNDCTSSLRELPDSTNV